MPSSLSGFTLLELLVVVAVTAILATVALVSYQDARLKSQVAQSREHQRLISLALEAYRSDQSHYSYAGDALVGWIPSITTPVAYLASAGAARDPLLKINANHNGVKEFYLYENILDDPLMDLLYPLHPRNYRMQLYGAWVLTGYGPGPNLAQIPLPPWPEDSASYDASNGTESFGVIRRSQKRQ